MAVATSRPEIEPRDVRALTEYMTVLENEGIAKGAPGLYAVISQSGSQYIVDARTGACQCPDFQRFTPRGGCKHVRRVAFATGQRDVPTGIDAGDIDPDLGRHVDG